MRRSSSLHSIDTFVERKISNDKYQDVVVVSDNIDAITNTSEYIADIQEVSNNITNINIVATDIDNVNATGANIADVSIVAANIVDVVDVSNQIIPNLPEILLADDNAILVTSLYDQFDDRFLGAKDADPLVDNDGDLLMEGAIYWNTVLEPPRFRSYSSIEGWQDALTLSTNGEATLTNKIIDDFSNSIGADHIHYKVRNDSDSVIPINTVVTASGTQPGTDYLSVVPLTDNQTQVAVGIIHTELAKNGVGLVVNTGVINNIDTDTDEWDENTILYANSGGWFTDIKPTGNQYQACGIVLRRHASQGTILVEFTEPTYYASTSQAGYVELVNNLTTDDITKVVTAAQSKALKDAQDLHDSRISDIENDYGQPSGLATLDSNGLVPSTQLPSYVDDVIEVATYATLPTTGEAGKIYVVITDETSNGDTSSYRWTGSTYAMVSNTLTATDMLNLVKTVDGVDSGLDADLLDGQHGSYYAPLSSPEFTGVPTAPTASNESYTDQLATTNFVKNNTPVLVPDFTSLQAFTLSDGETIFLKELHPDIPESGGLFSYDASIDKSTADGGLIIDISESLATQGDGTGYGCLIRRRDDNRVLFDWYGPEKLSLTDYNTFINGANPTFGTIPTISSRNRLVLKNLIDDNTPISFGSGIYPFDDEITMASGIEFKIEGVSKNDTLLFCPNGNFIHYTAGGATHPYFKNIRIESKNSIVLTDAGTVNAIHAFNMSNVFAISYEDHTFHNDYTITGGTGCPIYGCKIEDSAFYCGDAKGMFYGWGSANNIFDNVTDLHYYYNGQNTNAKGIAKAIFYNSNAKKFCNSNIAYSGMDYVVYADRPSVLFTIGLYNNVFEYNTYSFQAIVKIVVGSSNINLRVSGNTYIGAAKENGYYYILQAGRQRFYEFTDDVPVYADSIENHTDDYIRYSTSLVDVGGTKYRISMSEPHTSSEDSTLLSSKLLTPSQETAESIGMGDIYSSDSANISYVQIKKSKRSYPTGLLTVETGTTGSRPTTYLFTARQYFDTTLGIPIWYNGSNWVDATGTTV